MSDYPDFFCLIGHEAQAEQVYDQAIFHDDLRFDTVDERLRTMDDDDLEEIARQALCSLALLLQSVTTVRNGAAFDLLAISDPNSLHQAASVLHKANAMRGFTPPPLVERAEFVKLPSR